MRLYGVVEVVRVRPDTIHVLLHRELTPPEVRYVRRIGRDWWCVDHVVLSVQVNADHLPDKFELQDRSRGTL